MEHLVTWLESCYNKTVVCRLVSPEYEVEFDIENPEVVIRDGFVNINSENHTSIIINNDSVCEKKSDGIDDYYCISKNDTTITLW